MQLTVYRDEAGFAALRREWNALLDRARFNTVFLTWEWQTTWWSSLGKGELWLLAWRDDGGDLVAIVPLYLETSESGQRRLTLVGCLEVSDYLDMIITAGREAEVYTTLLDWLASAEAPSWHVLDLCNLPEASLVQTDLAGLAESRGYVVASFQEDVCPIIDLPESWEAYLATLGKKQRHEVRRKLRRAQEAGEIGWYIVGDGHDLSAEMEDFIELHRLSEAGKDQFMQPQMQGFFHAIARAMMNAGWLQLSFLEVNGDKAATMICFDYAGCILVYNSGYDPQRYSAISAGIVLLAKVIRHAIEELGRVSFDFLQGDEVYKYRFGARETKVYRTLVSQRRA